MRFLSFIWKDTTQRPGELLLILTGIAFGIAGTLVLFSLRLGIEQTLFNTAESKNPLSEIMVYSKGSSPFFSLVGGSKASYLTDDDIQKISTIPEVKSIVPQSTYHNLASIEFNLLGQLIQTDALVLGVPKEIVESDISKGTEWKAPTNNEKNSAVPVVISKRLIDIYNLSLAPGAGLPTISEKTFVGTPLKIYLGFSSFFAGQEKPKNPIVGTIVGFSNRVDLVGISVPLPFVEKLNRDLNHNDITTYNKLFVSLDSPQNVEKISENLISQGYQVSSVQKEFEGVGKSLGYTGIILFVLTGIILGMSILLISSTLWSSIMKRKKEFGLLRAMGASYGDLIKEILIQALFLGIAGAFLGLALGQIIIFFFQRSIAASWEFSSVSPDQLFVEPPMLLAGLCLTAVIIAAIASLLPMIKLRKSTPRKLIST